jgi:hypothetical protein
MKFLFTILASVALIGVLYAGDTYKYQERTRTKTSVRSSGCTGSVKATSCTGRQTTVTKASAGCVGSSRTSFYSRTRTR